MFQQIRVKKMIDIGNLCIDCKKDTSFGSGLFVNRVPADNGKEEGYLCSECQMIECDVCDQLTNDWEYNEDGILHCLDCWEEKSNENKQNR
tara:strand:- start:80 stop:352 length:273 start_codon:yes stop_codon:yes gene_type:complete